MKLNVAICQVDMEWEETEHNLSRIEKVEIGRAHV